jgi:hypothetical protein
LEPPSEEKNILQQEEYFRNLAKKYYPEYPEEKGINLVSKIYQ